MSFPPLAGGEHTILSSEFCSGYVDTHRVYNTGFYCPQTGSVFAVYCCGTPTYKYCCTTKPVNGTGGGVVENFTLGGTGGTTISRPTGSITENGDGTDNVIPLDSSGVGNGYSGATRMRPSEDLNNNDLTSLNLSDVPIIFGVACGVAAVLILVILVGFYLTSCCAHYHKLAQNRKRRSSMTGIYRGVTTTNASTTSGLVNLYSPTNSVRTSAAEGSLPGSLARGDGVATTPSADNTQTYIVHHHHHNNSSSNNPPETPDSSSPYHLGIGSGGVGGSASLVATPLDIEWSSTTQYLQKPQQSVLQSSSQLQHPLNLLSNHFIAATDNRIHYTVHQTQNRLAVALTGSMNRLSDHHGDSPYPNPASSSYPVNIPLTPPGEYSYSRQIPQGLSPPPHYSSSLLCRAESPPYYPSYDNGGGMNNMDIHHKNQQYHQNHNYLSRTSTLPLSLAKKPPSGVAIRSLITSPVPPNYGGSNLFTPQQPKSILRTSENFRRVVTNETPPPIPPHNSSSALLYAEEGRMEGAGGGSGNIAYRNVDSRTCSQSLLILESKLDNNQDGPPPSEVLDDDDDDDEENGLHTATLLRRSSISTGVNVDEEEEAEDEEKRDQFDIHDIDSDALSRLLEIDCDSKL